MELYSDPAASKYVSGGKLNYGRQIPFNADHAPYVRGTAKPEDSWHYFTPGDLCVRYAPDEFRRKIKEIDPRFEVIWHPVRERWVVWANLGTAQVKSPRLKGWSLIFTVQYSDETFMPLDERTLARAWDRCGRKHGSFKRYWDQVEAAQDYEYNKRLADRRQHVRDMAGDQWDSQRISISMRGQSTGSKFSKHHAGG
jgi:hypothetical protein